MQGEEIKRSMFITASSKAVYVFTLISTLISTLSSCNKLQDSKNNVLDTCEIIAKRQIVNGDTITVCDLDAIKSAIEIPLSLMIDNLKVIKLDNRDEAFVGRSWPTISEHYIGIREDNGTYKLFDKDGNFVSTIGNIGQGPGEYNYIYYSQIDELNNLIYLLPWSSTHIHVYNLNGIFIKSIPLSFFVPKGIINVDWGKEELTVIKLSFDDGEEPTIWKQDFNGNIIAECAQSYLQVFPTYGNEVFAYENTEDIITFSFLRSQPTNDTLYSYHSRSNRLKPLFTSQSENSNDIHLYRLFSHYYITEIWGSITNQRLKKYLTSWINGRIIVDNLTLRGGRCKLVNDFLGGIHLENELGEFGYTMCKDDGFAICIEPGRLIEIIDERLHEHITAKDRDFLTSWKEQISDDDNNYVIWGKMKE